LPPSRRRPVAALAGTLAAKLEAQKSIKALESTRSQKRRELFDAQDAIDQQRDGLIGKIEKQMRQRHNGQPLFLLHWNIV
jgi:adenine-specific DNA-methyltransferase